MELVEAGGHWYLLAMREGADRTYRLSRVEEVQELDEPADRPPDTDLADVWQQRRARFRATRPGATATVRVRADRREALARIVAECPDGPGMLRVELVFADALHAERMLWTLGADVEVLGPAWLRETMAARAAAVAALYT